VPLARQKIETVCPYFRVFSPPDLTRVFRSLSNENNWFSYPPPRRRFLRIPEEGRQNTPTFSQYNSKNPPGVKLVPPPRLPPPPPPAPPPAPVPPPDTYSVLKHARPHPQRRTVYTLLLQIPDEEFFPALPASGDLSCHQFALVPFSPPRAIDQVSSMPLAFISPPFFPRRAFFFPLARISAPNPPTKNLFPPFSRRSLLC